MKVLCYGIAESEIEIFKKANEKYGYELILENELLSDANVDKVPAGTDAIVLFVNSDASERNLKIFKEKGVKHVVTRTAGYDHVDIDAATKLGYKIARVPAYSPTAVASLGFADGVALLRKVAYISNQASNYNFVIDSDMFAREFKNSTIGVIGTGKIGYETAKYWKGTGARVLGYDIYQSDAAKEVLEYTELDDLLKQSDLISIHVPYFKGQNDNFVDQKMIDKLKDGAVIVNVSRKNLVDHEAIVKNIKSGKLSGYAADVFNDEENVVSKKMDEATLKKINPTVNELVKLYPKVLISPHVAYFTDEAVKNMAEISFENLDNLEKTGTCENVVNK